MSGGLTYLITGANRGIGLGLTQALLQRLDGVGVEGLAELGEGRVGGAVELGGQEGAGGVARAGGEVGDGGVEGVADAGYYGRVGALDVVVANAGSSAGYAPILTTSLAALRSDYETNALGPVRLFQACYELLSRSRTGMAKFVLVSSVLGSIGALDGEAGPALAYGTSKAAANFFVRKVHFEHADVVALAIHPGWVKTDMGQGFADAVGVKSPPMELDVCVKGLLEQIDLAANGTTSGSFISYDGNPIPW